MGFKAKMDEDSKKQASGAIKMIIKRFQVKRAAMLVRYKIKEKYRALMDQKLVSFFTSFEESYSEGSISVTAVIPPNVFRELDSTLNNFFGGSSIQIVDPAIINDDVAGIGIINTLEEREGYEEELAKENCKQSAERDIEELEIEKNLANVDAIQPAKKQKK